MKKVKNVLLLMLSITILVSLVSLSWPLAASVEEENGIVMALEFDDGAPENPNVATAVIKDSSSNQNDALMQNPKTQDDTEYPTIRYTEGKFGSALRLNGAMQYIDVKKSVFDSDAITIAFWVNYRGGPNWQRFFEMGTAETGEHIMIIPSATGEKFQISGYNKKEGSSFIANPTDSKDDPFKFPLNKWTHVAMTMDAEGNTSLYFNGEALSLTALINKGGAEQTIKNKTSFKAPVSFKYVNTISGLQNPDWFGTRLGCSATSTWDSMLLGSLDAVKVYHRALTPKEVTRLYQTNTTLETAVSETPASSEPAASSTVSTVSIVSTESSSAVSGDPQSSQTEPTSSEAPSTGGQDESEVSEMTSSSEVDMSSMIEASGSETGSEYSGEEQEPEGGIRPWTIVLIAAGVMTAAGVCLFIFKDKIFKKK